MIACSLGGSAEDIKGGDPAKLPIASAHLGNAVACEGSRGDVWTTIWADDHQLYSVSDDTTGFDNACSSNLAVHSIVRETPPNLRGKTPESDEAVWGLGGSQPGGWRFVESLGAGVGRRSALPLH